MSGTRAYRTRAGRPGRRDRGAAALELAILTPVLILLIGFAVVAGRVAVANASITTIAGNSARQASLARDARSSAAAATTTARANLATENLHCDGGGYVAADTSGFAAAGQGTPGQTVTVTVTCVVSFADVAIPGLPGSRTLTDTGVSPLDPNRATSSNAGPWP